MTDIAKNIVFNYQLNLNNYQSRHWSYNNNLISKGLKNKVNLYYF